MRKRRVRGCRLLSPPTPFHRHQEERSEIRFAHGATGEYLRTDRDNTTRNNLDDLPDQ